MFIFYLKDSYDVYLVGGGKQVTIINICWFHFCNNLITRKKNNSG